MMENKLEITAISDLHGNLPNPEIFDGGDVLCICGDIVPLDIQRDFVKCIAWICGEFIPWTDKLTYKKVLVIFGNHDFVGEELGPKHYNNGDDITKMLLPIYMKGKHKVVFLCDNQYKYEGFKFYGTSWCPDLSDWAFYGNSDELKQAFAKIPEDTDVLLTHCPPKLYDMGTVLQNGYSFGRNFGCDELADAIIERPLIKWVFCGHVHSGEHHPQQCNGTNLVNVSMLDENYRMNYLPFNCEVVK